MTLARSFVGARLLVQRMQPVGSPLHFDNGTQFIAICGGGTTFFVQESARHGMKRADLALSYPAFPLAGQLFFQRF